MRLLSLLALLTLLTACVSDWNKDYATMKRPDPAATSYDVTVPQPNNPELDPKRPVSDQDCTKPVDPAGNLRCR